MAKLTLTDPSAGYNSTSVIAANNTLVEAAIENTLSRDGTAPNQMEAALDMNSYRITNLPNAVGNQEPLTLSQASTLASISTAFTQENVGAVLYPQTSAEVSAAVTPTNYYYPPGNVLRYGTNTTPGTTDMTTAIQNAINVVEVNGGQVFIPAGTYLITSTLTIDNSNVEIRGESGSFNGGPTLNYNDASGVALDIGDGTNAIYSINLYGFRINATGTTTSSGTAKGIRLRNARYHNLRGIFVQNFQSGTGIEDVSAGASFGATGVMQNCIISTTKNCLVVDTNHLTVIGGFCGSQGGAGSICIDIQSNAASTSILATDCESGVTGIKDAGARSRIMARTEFITGVEVDVVSGADHSFIASEFASSASTAKVADAGTNTYWMDAWSDFRIDISTNSGNGAFIMPNQGAILCKEAGGTNRNVLSMLSNDVFAVGITNNQTSLRGSTVRADGPFTIFDDFTLRSRTDANRGSAGTAGRVIFNTDDGNINIDNGTNWILPDGTTT